MLIYLVIKNMPLNSFLRDIIFQTNNFGQITFSGISDCDTINNVFDCRFRDINVTNDDEYYINLADFFNVNKINIIDIINDINHIVINVLPQEEWDTSFIEFNLFKIIYDYSEIDLLQCNITYVIQ